MKANDWYRIGRCNSICLCMIDADGTFQVGPLDWDVTKTGVGLYKIQHNLGHTRYIALPVPLNGSDYKINGSIQTRTATEITVGVFQSTTAFDFPIGVLVILTQ